MDSNDKFKVSKPIGLQKELLIYLKHLAENDPARLEALLRTILSKDRLEKIVDLWKQAEPPKTYWILLSNGVDQPEEMKMATALVTWGAIVTKDAAQTICIQSSERNEFRLCSSHFGVANYPTLVFSDSPGMHSCIKIEPQLLFRLITEEGSLRRFLTKIHALIENGANLHDIKRTLQTERFWSGLKLVYGELKSFVSFLKS